MALQITDKDGWTWIHNIGSDGEAMVLCPSGRMFHRGSHYVGLLQGNENPTFTRSFWDMADYAAKNAAFNANAYKAIGYIRTIIPYAAGIKPIAFAVLPFLAGRQPYQATASTYIPPGILWSRPSGGVDFISPGLAREIMISGLPLPPFYALNGAAVRNYSDIAQFGAVDGPTGALWLTTSQGTTPSLFGTLDLSTMTEAHLAPYVQPANVFADTEIDMPTGTIFSVVAAWIKKQWDWIGDADLLHARIIGRYLTITVAGPEEFNPLVCARWEPRGNKMYVAFWVLDWYQQRDMEVTAVEELIKNVSPDWPLREDPMPRDTGRTKGAPPPLGLQEGQVILRLQVIDAVCGWRHRTKRQLNQDAITGELDLLDGYTMNAELRYDIDGRSVTYNPPTAITDMQQGDRTEVFAAYLAYQSIIADTSKNFIVDTTNFDLVGAPGLYPPVIGR